LFYNNSFKQRNIRLATFYKTIEANNKPQELTVNEFIVWLEFESGFE